MFGSNRQLYHTKEHSNQVKRTPRKKGCQRTLSIIMKVDMRNIPLTALILLVASVARGSQKPDKFM